MKTHSIMVTGASGFIGRATLEAIRQQHPDVIGLIRGTTKYLEKEMKDDNIISCFSDEWPTAIISEKPKILILCDWEGVGGINREDGAIQGNNVSRWIQIFESAKIAGVERIIAFGSQAEITKEQDGVPSDIEFSPRTAYGEAKAKLFRNLSALSNTSDIQFDWIRIFSVYGEHADNVWLIPKVISALQKGEAISLTACEQEWNFLHVDDVANAVVKVLGQKPSNGAINVANPVTHKLSEVLNFIGDRMNRKNLLKYGEMTYPEGQVMVMKPNLEEILRTGWSPEIDLYKYLEREM